jgi:L-ascorbate metabolism protein UlaG (beta-lactamase superfamily)
LKILKKYGPVDFALLPIGAYEPRWFMKESHMNPEEAVQAHLDLKSKKSIGIHFGTWKLTDEGLDDPIVTLQEKLKLRMLSGDEFQAPQNGQVFEIHL